MTVEQAAFTGIAACASAIVFLFRLEQINHVEAKAALKELHARLSSCEMARQDLAVRVAVLEVPARQLEIVAAKAASDLKTVALEVAEELRKLKQ